MTLDPDKLAETAALWARAQGVLASGQWTPTQGVLHHARGAFPLMARSAEGCRLVDTSGSTYVDWMMGWGPVVLGYRHPRVEAAIAEQLAEGPLLSLLHPLEIEVAESLRDVVPCADGVAFGKNGSDVLAGAVRLARAHTGRERVLVHGYHGCQDWYMASIPACEGIPSALRGTVQGFDYNDLDGLAQLLGGGGGEVACVVMEPTSVALPEDGYLEGVRELTRAHGALLVFDEVITGFRLALGGAQEAFGVIPDLACFGKGLANGMPLSALCGREEVLRTIPGIGYGLTYRGETLSLAAARAALEVHRTEPVCEHLARVGEALRAGFRADCERLGIAADLCGPAARMSLCFEPRGRLAGAGLQALFVQECLKRSVLTNGNFLPSYAHDEGAVEETLGVFTAALGIVGQALEADALEDLLEVPVLPVFFDEAL